MSLSVQHLSFSYGARRVLQDVSLDVAPGTFCSLLGPNGSGKSTLVKAIAGVHRAQSGTVAVEGGSPIPFLNSCICGLTADASAATTPDQKQRYGVFAYVANTMRELAAYDGLEALGSGTEGAACTFKDNALGKQHRYGAIANLGPKVVWDESNVWVETGKPVKGG